MAATSNTMAEVLEEESSSSSSSQLSSPNQNNNNKTSGSGEYNNLTDAGKEENGYGSSNMLMKTFPYLTITVYIPTGCVGVLIGKRGSNIDSIQKLAAKESTKTQPGGPGVSPSPRGVRNKSTKQNNNNNNSGNQKAVSPESVRISVVNFPQFEQSYGHYKNPQLGNPSTSGQQQKMGGPSSLMDTGVPPTYTELDFSDPQWTPIVIRADPIAAIYAANAIHDICCPEYVVDRNQLVYIIDVPVPAVAAANSNNANLRHASIVGKRGNKLIQLSADHKCRIMVPPKQLGHNVIQLEAPLKECCSCLRAISTKLQAGAGSSFDDKEQQSQQHGDATKVPPNTPPPKNAKNNNGAKPNNSGKSKNDNAKNNFQMTLIIQPLPSQTKLRNIARKTETKILKKRIPKSQQRNSSQKQQQQQQQPLKTEQEQDQDSKQTEQPVEGTEASDQQQEKQEEQGNINNDNSNNANSNANSNSDVKVSWRLTVLATSEKKIMRAVDMLKVLNTKGYEVIVEESDSGIVVDTSTKSVESMVGGSEDDPGTGTDSSTNGGATDGPRAPGTPNGRGGGRGGRNKKQRHRNNNRGNNGRDSISNNNTTGKQQPTTAAAVDGS